jgi:AcrR family transcriptional regulator
MNTVQQRFSAEDRRQQILEVAKAIFSRKGYEGTTTREIATAAKVNEAIIFRHFPTKEELYWAVIDYSCKSSDARGQMIERLRRGGELQDVFRELALEILNRRSRDQSLTRLLFFSALENHELSQRFFDHYVAQFYETLASFVKEQIVAGKFRDVDPMVAARGFLGMVIYYSLVDTLFVGGRLKKHDHQHTAEQLSSIWLKGMLPENSSAGV